MGTAGEPPAKDRGKSAGKRPREVTGRKAREKATKDETSAR
jgi:hypothetical protein